MLELDPNTLLDTILEYVGEDTPFSVDECMEWVDEQDVDTDEGAVRECLWVLSQHGTLGRKLVDGEFYRYWVVVS